MVTVGIGLRERALAAHRALLEDYAAMREEQEREEREKKAVRLKELLAQKLQIFSAPIDNEWMHEGIVFHAAHDGHGYGWHLYISEECPVCDSHRISQRIDNLADLGAALSGATWRPHEHYYAEDSAKVPAAIPPPVPAPLTVDERLIDALRAFVEEYTLSGGSDA